MGQEARVQAAQTEVTTARNQLNRSKAYLEHQREKKLSIEYRVLEAEALNKSFHDSLVSAKAQLSEKTHARDEAQKEWRLQHLERIDARIAARRSLDLDIVVAEATSLDDCTAPAH